MELQWRGCRGVRTGWRTHDDEVAEVCVLDGVYASRRARQEKAWRRHRRCQCSAHCAPFRTINEQLNTEHHTVPLMNTEHHYVPLMNTTQHYVPLMHPKHHYVPLMHTKQHYVPLMHTKHQ